MNGCCARGLCLCSARDQLLAGARFARDQHRHVRLRQAPDGAKHFLPGRRLAQNFRGVGGARFDARFAQAFVERAPDQLDGLVDIEGFGQVLEGAALERRHGRLQVGKSGDDDDRQPRIAGLDGLQQVQARFTWHADVRHQHLRRLQFERRHHVVYV